jgi:DNA-binding MarR family transcriptional regulator
MLSYLTMPKRSTSALKPVVDLLGKRLSTATILFHSAVADRMGVSVADARCRSLLLQLGPMTAGGLALRLGLTTGAVTGVIDRLERARLARRVADPKDRRRVVVELVANRRRDQAIARLFAPMGRRVVALAGGYSEKERTTIFEFMSKACEILDEETTRLRRL